MNPSSLRIIRDEHNALAALLRSLSMLLAEHRRRRTTPDFAVLRAMLFYIDEFPERLHHTKESLLLFPRVRARSDEAGVVLDRLDRDHARGGWAIRELEHSLLAFEVMGASRRDAFEEAADRYVDFYLGHMQVEEREILPLAKRVLTDADWAEIDAEFEQNRDPLTGHQPAAEYRELYRRIVRMLPAPLGVG